MSRRNTGKNDLFPESDSEWDQSQNKARSTTLNDSEDEQEDIDDIQFARFSSPTFNIHIHVPHYASNNSKIFLPKIQPIINLHFDELARKLKNNSDIKNEKYFSKTFQNLLSKISPKFGVVKFHFPSNSEERNIQEPNVNNVTPNTSKKCHNDVELQKNINSEKARNVTTKTNETVVDNNNRNKSSKPDSNFNSNNNAFNSYELHKDIKLKKAVVVLTDISKTKTYRHFFESSSFCKNENNENESSRDSVEELEHNCSGVLKYEAETNTIKNKEPSLWNKSVTTELSKNEFDISDEDCFTDNDNNLKGEKDINSPLKIKKNYCEKDQNLTALVEGWSFSDILNRFQIKRGEKHDNYLASSNSSFENKNNIGETDDNMSHELNKSNEVDFEEEPNSDSKLHVEVNKNEMDSSKEDCFNENKKLSPMSDESFSFLQFQNETVREFLMNESNVIRKASIDDFKNMAKENIKSEFIPDSDDSGSDDCKIISGKEMSSKSISDVKIVEHDLSSSSAVQENKFEVPETNKSSLSNVTLPSIHLELIKKEMQRRNLNCSASGQTQKIKKPAQTKKSFKSKKSDTNGFLDAIMNDIFRKSFKTNHLRQMEVISTSLFNISHMIESSPPESASSPKKMKFSNEQPEISEQKTMHSSPTKSFIRLNSSGPTELFVSSLNKFKPSTSKAKDFKKNMLFGNRVNRFSSSDQLRIYQLKKEAARKSVNY